MPLIILMRIPARKLAKHESEYTSMVEVAGSVDVESRLRDMVCEQLDVTPERVTSDTIFMGDENLGADSLDMVELVMSVEEEFGIEVDDDQVESITTFGDAVRLIDERLNT